MAERAIRPMAAYAAMLGAVIGAAIAAAVLFWFDPQRFHFYPICLFHRFTGLLCPGCGTLRALHQLLHGHLLAAIRFNALLVISLPFLAWAAGRCAAAYLTGRTWRTSVSVTWIWSAMVLLLVFTVLRNLPVGHALCLAP